MPLRLFIKLWLVVCILVVSFTTLAQDDVPMIQWMECPFDMPDGESEGETLDSGYFITYEDHYSDDDEAQVELAFVLLYSINEPVLSPVIYLDGGPAAAPSPAWQIGRSRVFA